MSVKDSNSRPLEASFEVATGRSQVDLDADTTRKIFESKPPYKDGEEEICRRMVETLTEIEQEQAARSSYAYFVSSTATEKDRAQMAMRMARRHLVAEKGNEKKALEKMKNTLRFREDMKIDDIRRCFSTCLSNDDNSSGDDSSSIRSIRSIIETDVLATEAMVVRGYDKGSRAMLLKFNRTKFIADERTFFLVQLYWMERALACTERKSEGKEETMNVVADYNGYSRKNKPPLGLAINLVRMLHEHYPERLNMWIAVDPPFFLRTIWKIVSIFVDPATREKTKFISGEEQKGKELAPYISKDQAMPFLLPGGQLTSPLDFKRFLYDVPFDHGHDE